MKSGILIVLLTFTFATSIVESQVDAQADLALQNKLVPYIKCINQFSDRGAKSFQRYLSWIEDSDQGPTGKERVKYGLYTLSNPSDCVAGIASISKQAPRVADLEAAGEGYATAVQVLYRVTKDANDYYEMENWRDDEMKLGKAMHPGLMAAFGAFIEAALQLRGAVEESHDALQLSNLKRIEAESGKSLSYHVTHLSIRAKSMARAGTVGELESIDLEIYQTSLESFESAYSELRDFARDHPEAVAGVAMYDTLESRALEFLKSAKKLGRYRREGHIWSDIERSRINSGSSWMVEGSPGRLASDYNAFVRTLNNF